MIPVQLQLFGGRGSKSGGEKPTRARDIDKMNDAQLGQEIKKAQAAIDRYKKLRSKYGAQSGTEKALQGAFPLGAGGLKPDDSKRFTGGLSERALNRGKKLGAAIKGQERAEKRLELLKKEQERRKKPTKPQGKAPALKWQTVQKQQRTGQGLTPQIIKSGAFEIRGKSAPRVYRDGKLIGQFSSLNEAKQFAERLANRK